MKPDSILYFCFTLNKSIVYWKYFTLKSSYNTNPAFYDNTL